MAPPPSSTPSAAGRRGKLDLEEGIEAEAEAQTINLPGPDTAEAFEAFLRKRAASYTGGRTGRHHNWEKLHERI